MVTPRVSPYQLVNVSLAGGLDAKTDEKQVAPPQTLVAENVDYAENRNLCKRNGATYMSGGVSRGSPGAILSVDDKLLVSGSGGLNVLSGGKWLGASNYTTGYDVTTKPFISIPVGPAQDVLSSYSAGTPFQRPAAVKFADIGNFRLIAVESLHVKSGTGLTPIIYKDAGAIVRFYVVDLTTGQVIASAIHDQQYCRDVVVKVLGTDWYVAYMKRTTSEVIKITGPVGSSWFGSLTSYTVCTGSAVVTYSQDASSFCDMQSIGGRLYHAVTVNGGSQVVVSSLAIGTAFSLVKNVSWFSGEATQICLTGFQDVSGTVNHILLGNYKRFAAFKHTPVGGATTTTVYSDLSSGRYLSVPFDLAYVPATSTVLMTDGQLAVTTPYNVSTGSTGAITVSNIEVDGSAVTAPASDPQQDDMNTNAARYPGGLYAQLRSRIFIGADGSPRAWVAHTDGATQSVDFLLRLDATAVGGVASAQADASMLYNSVTVIEPFRNPSSSHARGLGTFLHGHPSYATSSNFYEIVTTNLADEVYTLLNVTYSTVSAAKRTLIRVPGGALQSGSIPTYFDGQNLYTPGRFNSPVFDIHAIDYGGSLDPTEVADANNLAQPQDGEFEYTYFTTTTWYDASGRQMLGAVSPPFKVTVASPNDTVVFPSILANFLPEVQVYRNSYQFPGVYNRVRFQIVGGEYYDRGNDDTTSQLYALPDGGELINDPFPPLTYAVSSVDRVYGIPSEAPDSLVWSKPFRDGRVIEYNADNRMVIAPADGANVALGIIDYTLFVFKKRQIYAMSIATAPDATGQGAFGDVALIASDVGCVDANSVMLTPSGLFFRSERGLQLMTTGGSVQYIGAPVERLLQGKTIIDSTLVSAKNQCRFALSDGTILVFDHFLQRWSVYTGWAPQSSTMHQGKYTFVTASGQVCVEGTGYQDTLSAGQTVNYALKVQSPWLPLGEGLQGCGRIRRMAILGDYVADHTLRASFAYDYDPAWAYTVDCKASGKAQWVVRAPRQVAQAVSIQLTDIPGAASAGQSLTISDINMELAAKGGIVRTPVQRRL